MHVAPIREKSITQLNRTYQVCFCYRYYLIKKCWSADDVVFTTEGMCDLGDFPICTKCFRIPYRGDDVILCYRKKQNVAPVLQCPQNKCYFAVVLHKSTTESTSTCVYCLYDIPSLFNNSSHTSDPKMHHPAMDPLVLSLQRGKAIAVFVPSKNCDIVGEVSKCGCSGMD